MKILVAGCGYDTRTGHSLGIFELDQAKALLAAGHDVRFAAVDTRSPRRLRPLGGRRYTLEGLQVYYGAVPGVPRPEPVSEWLQRRAGGIIWKMLEEDGWRPDVVHAHFGLGLLAQGRAHGVPTVFTEHFSGSNRPEVDRGELYRERVTYGLADRLLCVSSPLAARLAARTGVTGRVVHNIVDTGSFPPPEDRREDRREFRFVAVGNLIQRKGFDLLLEAFAQAAGRSDLPLALTIIGGGPQEAPLRAQAEKLGIGDLVTFTGRLERPKIAEHFRHADAFVLPSRLETFGVVYIEAMAAGLPVIATACGGPEDFVDDTNGVLVPVEDVPALTGAMERMAERRGDYDRQAIAARARERFSPEKIAGELTAVYEELLSC